MSDEERTQLIEIDAHAPRDAAPGSGAARGGSDDTQRTPTPALDPELPLDQHTAVTPPATPALAAGAPLDEHTAVTPPATVSLAASAPPDEHTVLTRRAPSTLTAPALDEHTVATQRAPSAFAAAARDEHTVATRRAPSTLDEHTIVGGDPRAWAEAGHDELARTAEYAEASDAEDVERTQTHLPFEDDAPFTTSTVTSPPSADDLLLDDDDIVEILAEDLIDADDLVEEEPATEQASTERQWSRAPLDGGHEGVAAPLDPEEEELLAARRFDALLRVYRERLEAEERPSAQATLLLKIAGVLETGTREANDAFDVLVQAFELAPDHADVISALDRVGKATQRIGELADRVRRQMVPSASDERRVALLAHVVYWYERVLGRGRETSPLVSEIERRDKVHPLALKRAAQLAAMNGDVKSQREHLTRALERTIRAEERAAIHLALASAHAGTPEALEHYEHAAGLDPTSVVALQGIKRLAKEREDHAKVAWALERLVEVAPTGSERVDALIELAELSERNFLKRELAAELLERALEIEPAQPAALKALERCYHALRDWRSLVRVLELRAQHTFDKRSKIELLELAAEVYESKLEDVPAAIDTYQNLALIEPKHRRALGDLARLSEKMADWAAFATYRVRLAELAPTKRARSAELVKLGDYLNDPERDPLEAKAQYERAVAVDATNAAGWEALQRLASAAGDTERVIECLEQRKRHTEVPRQRALVLVELANAHAARGDEGAARACFEAAVSADSGNEQAAAAMLDTYVAEERWLEAAPLCELLVNAAVRDRDGDALFGQLRLAARIAAALGDLDRAVGSAIAALDARPADPAAQRDLITIASQCGDAPAALDKARARLAAIVETAEHLEPGELARLAAVQRSAGDIDGAAVTLERALGAAPESRDILAELAEVYLAQADYPRACKLKVDLARSAANGDVRFDLLCEAGEVWARRAGELEKALSIFDEARLLRPLDPWLLQTYTWIYSALGDRVRLLGALEELSESGASPADKQEALLGAATLFAERFGDPLGAADLYDRVLDLDASRLDVFETLVRLLTEEKAWERLEGAYRAMLARVEGGDDTQLAFMLHQQLGLICRDRLSDAARAYDALDAAARLRPDDAEVRKMLVELLVVTDNLDSAVARVREAIDRDPHQADAYGELYDLFLRQRAFDKAWCTVNVLASLRELSGEQRRFHEDYAPTALDQVPGQIVEQAWRSHVFHAELDPAMTRLLALLTPIVVQMRHAQLRPEQRVGRPFTPAHSRMHDVIRATFANAAEILSMSAPELMLGETAAGAAITPAIISYGALLVSAPALEAQAASLAYLAGKRLAEQRPELAARAFFPSVAELTVLLEAAVRISRNETARDPASAALDARFRSALSADERDAVRAGVLATAASGPELDVERWFFAADLSSMRAGLLLAGDVAPAREAILAEASAGPDMPPRDKIGELYKFATSDLYADLRGAIGVAVQD